MNTIYLQFDSDMQVLTINIQTDTWEVEKSLMQIAYQLLESLTNRSQNEEETAPNIDRSHIGG
jgi:hypothetical protein